MWSRCCTRRPDPRAEPPPPHRTRIRVGKSLFRMRVVAAAVATIALAGATAYATQGSRSGLAEPEPEPSATAPEHHPLRSHRLRELQRAADPSERHRSHARLQVEPAGHFPGPAPQHREHHVRHPVGEARPPGAADVRRRPLRGPLPRRSRQQRGLGVPRPPRLLLPRGVGAPAGPARHGPDHRQLEPGGRISAPHPSPGTLRLAPTAWRWPGPSPSRSP